MRDGNGLASRTALLALLASCMQLIWLLEQPRQSILESHKRIDKLWQSITAWKASWWMGCFNGPTAKPHYLICNLLAVCRGMDPWLYIRIFSDGILLCPQGVFLQMHRYGYVDVHYICLKPRKGVLDTCPKQRGRS